MKNCPTCDKLREEIKSLRSILQREREMLRDATNRLRVMNRVATDYTIQYDSQGRIKRRRR